MLSFNGYVIVMDVHAKIGNYSTAHYSQIVLKAKRQNRNTLRESIYK